METTRPSLSGARPRLSNPCMLNDAALGEGVTATGAWGQLCNRAVEVVVVEGRCVED